MGGVGMVGGVGAWEEAESESEGCLCVCSMGVDNNLPVRTVRLC